MKIGLVAIAAIAVLVAGIAGGLYAISIVGTSVDRGAATTSYLYTTTSGKATTVARPSTTTVYTTTVHSSGAMNSFSTTTSTVGIELIAPAKPSSAYDLLRMFSAAKIILRSVDGGNRTVSIDYSYTEAKLGGSKVYKVDVTMSSDGSEQQAAIWLSKDFTEVLRIEMGGSVFEGAAAQQIGRSILGMFGATLSIGTGAELRFKVMHGDAELVLAGWNVEVFKPITVTIDGEEFRAYTFKIVNINDRRSTVKSVEGTVTELYSGYWYITHIKVLGKDSSLHELELTQLRIARR